MKRVKYACMLQTLHFILDPNFPVDEAKEKVKNEVETYKTNYGSSVKIVSEETLNDGSVIISIKKKVSVMMSEIILNSNYFTKEFSKN